MLWRKLYMNFERQIQYRFLSWADRLSVWSVRSVNGSSLCCTYSLHRTNGKQIRIWSQPIISTKTYPSVSVTYLSLIECRNTCLWFHARLGDDVTLPGARAWPSLRRPQRGSTSTDSPPGSESSAAGESRLRYPLVRLLSSGDSYLSLERQSLSSLTFTFLKSAASHLDHIQHLGLEITATVKGFSRDFIGCSDSSTMTRHWSPTFAFLNTVASISTKTSISYWNLLRFSKDFSKWFPWLQ